jgi:hypothetical protein
MCLPVIGAIASIGSAVAGFAGAQQQADATNAAYLANAAEANRAAGQQYANLNIKSDQTRASAQGEAFDQSIEALRKRSTAQVAASEAGVSGLSVDALIGDIYAQEGRRFDRLDTQYRAEEGAIRSQMDDVSANAQQRINSAPRAAQPSPLSFMFQGLGGAINAFRTPGMGTV